MKTNFNIQIPFFPGFYNTSYEFSDSALSEEIGYYSEEDGVEYDDNDFDVDYRGYEKTVAEAFVNEFKMHCPSFVVDIKNVEIDRPRYYNFRNDELFADVVLSENWLDEMLKFIEENKEWLTNAISNDWTSYDGFMSFMDNSVDEWINELKSDNPDARYVGTMIGYMIYLSNENIYDDILFPVLDNVYCHEFITLTESGKAKKDAHYEETHQPGWDMTNQLEINFE